MAVFSLLLLGAAWWLYELGLEKEEDDSKGKTDNVTDEKDNQDHSKTPERYPYHHISDKTDQYEINEDDKELPKYDEYIGSSQGEAGNNKNTNVPIELTTPGSEIEIRDEENPGDPRNPETEEEITREINIVEPGDPETEEEITQETNNAGASEHVYKKNEQPNSPPLPIAHEENTPELSPEHSIEDSENDKDQGETMQKLIEKYTENNVEIVEVEDLECYKVRIDPETKGAHLEITPMGRVIYEISVDGIEHLAGFSIYGWYVRVFLEDSKTVLLASHINTGLNLKQQCELYFHLLNMYKDNSEYESEMFERGYSEIGRSDHQEHYIVSTSERIDKYIWDTISNLHNSSVFYAYMLSILGDTYGSLFEMEYEYDTSKQVVYDEGATIGEAIIDIENVSSEKTVNNPAFLLQYSEITSMSFALTWELIFPIYGSFTVETVLIFCYNFVTAMTRELDSEKFSASIAFGYHGSAEERIRELSLKKTWSAQDYFKLGFLNSDNICLTISNCIFAAGYNFIESTTLEVAMCLCSSNSIIDIGTTIFYNCLVHVLLELEGLETFEGLVYAEEMESETKNILYEIMLGLGKNYVEEKNNLLLIVLLVSLKKACDLYEKVLDYELFLDFDEGDAVYFNTINNLGQKIENLVTDSFSEFYVSGSKNALENNPVFVSVKFYLKARLENVSYDMYKASNIYNKSDSKFEEHIETLQKDIKDFFDEDKEICINLDKEVICDNHTTDPASFGSTAYDCLQLAIHDLIDISLYDKTGLQFMGPITRGGDSGGVSTVSFFLQHLLLEAHKFELLCNNIIDNGLTKIDDAKLGKIEIFHGLVEENLSKKNARQDLEIYSGNFIRECIDSQEIACQYEIVMHEEELCELNKNVKIYSEEDPGKVIYPANPVENVSYRTYNTSGQIIMNSYLEENSNKMEKSVEDVIDPNFITEPDKIVCASTNYEPGEEVYMGYPVSYSMTSQHQEFIEAPYSMFLRQYNIDHELAQSENEDNQNIPLGVPIEESRSQPLEQNPQGNINDKSDNRVPIPVKADQSQPSNAQQIQPNNAEQNQDGK